MSNLFLLACVIFSPLLRVPYRAAIRSANSTPEGRGDGGEGGEGEGGNGE